MTNVFKQNTIEEMSLPSGRDLTNDYSSYQKTGRGIYEPVRIEDQPFPTRKVATDVVGETLNTNSGQVYRPINFNQPVTVSGDGAVTVSGDGTLPDSDPAINIISSVDLGSVIGLPTDQINIILGNKTGRDPDICYKKMAQSFKPVVRTRISRITFNFERLGIGDPPVGVVDSEYNNIKVNICANNNGVPGNILYTGKTSMLSDRYNMNQIWGTESLLFTDLLGDAGYDDLNHTDLDFHFDYNAYVALNPGTYYFVVEMTTQNGLYNEDVGSSVRTLGQPTNGSPRGNLFLMNWDGNWISEPNFRAFCKLLTYRYDY